jgi:glycosyltransferase involved in cell wall biosynthesis
MADKSKKKALYIITKSIWAGAGKYVYDLATNLPKDEFEVFVAGGGQGELAQKIKEAGIPYYEIRNFQRDINVLKEFLAYFEILWLFLKIRPDIIHANSSKAAGIAGTAALDYRFLTLNFRAKTVFTAHGWAFHENRPKWQIFLIKLFSRLTCLYYSKIICVSEFDYQSAIKNKIAPKRKLITIHNGIKMEDYNFLPKEKTREIILDMMKLSRPLDFYQTVWIGTIGEFTKNKGQKYLIDAAQKLFKIQNSKFKILIIGWGEEISNLKSQISNLKLENDVFLIENLSPAAPYIKAFDIFVLPSLKEGLPYTLLEAGLAELPVVATKVGGIPEIIDEYERGLLAEPANSEDLTEKIEELIKFEEKRKTFGVNLYQKVLREFSLEKMLNATLAAYE